MKVPWWHGMVYSFINILTLLPAMILNIRFHEGVVITYIAVIFGVQLLIFGVFQPQLVRLSPMFVLDELPERLVRKRKIMTGAGVVALLAGLYGVFALITGIGAPYE
jgi:hypothetical protein